MVYDGTSFPMKKLIGGLIALGVIYAVFAAASSTSTEAAAPPRPPAVPTATPVPPSKANAVAIDPRRLVSDPMTYIGANVKLSGNALTVTQNPATTGLNASPAYTWVQLMAEVAGKNSTESIVIEFQPPNRSLLRDECIRVYGVVAGTETVTRTLTGAQNTVPVLRGYALDQGSAGPYGIGCSAY
jgi:hypothetical protein